MIRLSWRQFRAQGAVAFTALLGVALVAAITGPHLVHLYDAAVAACPAGDCPITVVFPHSDTSLRAVLGAAVVIVPAVIGIFWGAPLIAREIETGTFRLAWTQSVTRTRWAAVKLLVVGLGSAFAVGVFSLLVTWWARPLDRAGANRFGTFDQRDLVPVGYAVFALALGVAAGLLLRRTLPAMATAGVVFIAVRLAFVHLVRPHLLTPARRALALDPNSTGFGSSGSSPVSLRAATLQPEPPHIPNAWITSIRIVDGAGHRLTGKVLAADCPATVSQGGGGGGGGGAGGGGGHGPVPAGPAQALHTCVAKVGATYHEAVTFLPANRYWALQWYETAIFFAAAFALAALCVWWVRRRLG